MAYKATDIQEKLNKHGYNLDVDGKIGPESTAAIKDFQAKNGLQVDGIVGPQTWGALTKAQNTTTTTPTATAPAQTEAAKPTWNHKKSDAVTQLWDNYNQLQKPGEYNRTWLDSLGDTINQIMNKEKFSYDLNGDALYQQYKDQYTTQGKLAMMDTMGQAAAMTGGYGNSYAQSAGQQAYQGYLQGLNDKIPELYQLALNQYNQEVQDLYDRAGLLYKMDEQEYGRNQDEWDRYYKDSSKLFEEAKYMDETEFNRALTEYEIANNSYWNNKNFDNTNEWKQKEFDEGVRKFDVSSSKSSSSSGSSEGNTKYKSLDVGSTAYNTIIGDIEAVETYDDLLSITKRYIALGYDPDEINELTAAKAKRLKPGDPVSARDALSNGLHGFSGTKYMLN